MLALGPAHLRARDFQLENPAPLVFPLFAGGIQRFPDGLPLFVANYHRASPVLLVTGIAGLKYVCFPVYHVCSVNSGTGMPISPNSRYASHGAFWHRKVNDLISDNLEPVISPLPNS